MEVAGKERTGDVTAELEVGREPVTGGPLHDGTIARGNKSRVDHDHGVVPRRGRDNKRILPRHAHGGDQRVSDLRQFPRTLRGAAFAELKRRRIANVERLAKRELGVLLFSQQKRSMAAKLGRGLFRAPHLHGAAFVTLPSIRKEPNFDKRLQRLKRLHRTSQGWLLNLVPESVRNAASKVGDAAIKVTKVVVQTAKDVGAVVAKAAATVSDSASRSIAQAGIDTSTWASLGASLAKGAKSLQANVMSAIAEAMPTLAKITGLDEKAEQLLQEQEDAKRKFAKLPGGWQLLL